MADLVVVPVDWRTARGFVADWHRHNAPLRGAGWRVVAERPARRGWDTPSRRRGSDYDAIPRTLWEAV